MVQIDAATHQPIVASLKPFLDGGTEGLKGQSRVIVPTLTSCFDCSLDTLPSQVTYPLCTIAETPRQPEHCIEYAMLVNWPRAFPEKKLDVDNPEDIEWMRGVAEDRAKSFGIVGTITTSLTLGVAKRIVPAVASTNAIVAASLAQEALKLATYMGPVLNNYLMYMGDSGIYTYTFDFAKNDSCLVCSGTVVPLERNGSSTLQELLNSFCDEHFRLKSPSISTSKGIVFMQKPAQLREAHAHKLGMTLRELTTAGVLDSQETVLFVTDPNVACKLSFRLSLSREQ
eukprot:GHVS01025349.1.p1 GENE.GHVS01025349.1~~GHVS01025349.1.p1  ORF type:complete len:285 (+),score=6.44 GHVS01025349.1:680-1534(+)